MSTTSDKGRNASKSSYPRGPYTPRGKSCSNCRRRKVKCDGKKPACSQCTIRLSNTSVCEYNGAIHSEFQALEANIKILQTRIRELELVDDAKIMLHQPYTNPEGLISEDETVVGLPVNYSNFINQSQDLMAQSLLDIFLRYARELGFFLHISTFRESTLLPSGSPGRPPEGLLSSISLLGSQLSGSDIEGAQNREYAYLSRAQAEVPNILSSSHPNRTVYAIQAEVLLSTYYFRTGRMLEGKYHLHAALSITFGSKLHKIHSQSIVASPSSSSAVNLELDAPSDEIAEGERINGFWTVFSLSNCWAVVAESPHNFMLESLGPTVDTPWPLDMTAYEQGALPSSLIGKETVTRFLNRESSSEFRLNGYDSALAIFAKCSILLARAAVLAVAYLKDTPQGLSEAFVAQFTAVDELLASFDSSFLPSSGYDSSSETFSFIMAAQLIKNAAIITLHSRLRTTCPQSAQKVLAAAEASVALVANRPEIAVHVNPLLAMLWMRIGQALIEEIRSIRSDSRRRTQPGREQDLIVKLRQVFGCMTCVPAPSRLNAYMLGKLQDMYYNI